MTETSIEKCCRMGWRVGDRIAGDEGFGLDVIEIVFMGRGKFLAQRCGRVTDGVLVGLDTVPEPSDWLLTYRDWRLWSRPTWHDRLRLRVAELLTPKWSR